MAWCFLNCCETTKQQIKKHNKCVAKYYIQTIYTHQKEIEATILHVVHKDEHRRQRKRPNYKCNTPDSLHIVDQIALISNAVIILLCDHNVVIFHCLHCAFTQSFHTMARTKQTCSIGRLRRIHNRLVVEEVVSSDREDCEDNDDDSSSPNADSCSPSGDTQSGVNMHVCQIHILSPAL